MKEVMLSARVPENLRKQLKREAARTGKTNEIILAAILTDFFKSWSPDERLKFYTGQPYARKAAA